MSHQLPRSSLRPVVVQGTSYAELAVEARASKSSTMIIAKPAPDVTSLEWWDLAHAVTDSPHVVSLSLDDAHTDVFYPGERFERVASWLLVRSALRGKHLGFHATCNYDLFVDYSNRDMSRVGTPFHVSAEGSDTPLGKFLRADGDRAVSMRVMSFVLDAQHLSIVVAKR